MLESLKLWVHLFIKFGCCCGADLEEAAAAAERREAPFQLWDELVAEFDFFWLNNISVLRSRLLLCIVLRGRRRTTTEL